jgi:hypothetical protein
MANSKISALPSATTPLAGTEVLPIVQGGITEQVSVANLTAGRAVSAASLALTTSPLPATSGGTGQASYAIGDLLYASTTTALAKLADVATGNALISGGISTAPSWGKIGLTTHISGVLPVANGGTNASSASITAFNNITGYTASGATGTTSTNLVFSTSPSITTPTLVGDATLSTGNLVIGTSGKGIDFSATSGTGTSELFDDYEEGTWTPIFDGATTQPTITYSASNGGKYTKIGRMVYAYGTIRTDSVTGGSGGLRLGGLPFTVASSTGSTLDARSGAVIGRASSFGVNFPISATALSTTTLVELWYRATSSGGVTQNTVADLAVGASSNLMIFTVIYEAA